MHKRGRTLGYLIVISLFILLISGCASSSDSGICRSVSGVYTHSWPTSNISISENTIDWIEAGTMWKAADLTFNYGIPGQIEYGGSINTPNRCGYALVHETNTTTRPCKIYLNEEIERLRDAVNSSLQLEEIKKDSSMVSLTKKVLNLIQEFKEIPIDKNTIKRVLKIQGLVKEIQS